MKKSSILLMMVIIASLLLQTVSTHAADGLTPISGVVLNDQINFTLNGESAVPVGDDGTPVLPILYKNTTYIPVRAIGYLLGLGVDYDGGTKTVLLTSTTTKVAPKASPTVKSGQLIAVSGALLNGQLKFSLDGKAAIPAGDDGVPVLPISYNGTTYLPVRAIANLLGLGIKYESTTKTVQITKGNDYTDDQGNEVTIISGSKAFADKAVSYVPGSPAPSNSKFKNPEEALGEPNYSGFTNNSATMSGILTLGGGGSVTLEFTQVYIVDGPGADIHVFEVGPAVEAMSLEVSKDNKEWVQIGQISGGTASVDLSGKVSSSDKFSFVRLTDLKSAPSGEWPGADLDAVAGINTVTKVSGTQGNEGDSKPAVEAKDYTDDQGNEVKVISGIKAFADKSVSFTVGSPAPSNSKFKNPEEALGEPNYSGFTNNSATMSGILSLGGGGTVTLEFTQVYIVDGPGVDIHVFEVGPAVESMLLEVSKDNKVWIEIGKISGGTASVDLSGKVSSTDQFSFVRLTDLKSAPSGEWPGADLDAVAGINTVIK